MITIRPSRDRGYAKFDWLDTHHTFSFGSYYDPQHMGFGSLRVLNEDRIAPSQGFGTHGHRDMEIVTYVLSGALAHRDSIGNGAVMRPGDVQRMSAGTGIQHSEFNASDAEPVHLLQIWLLPNQTGLAPSYEQTYFAPEEKQGRLRLIGSPDGREGAVTIHQDVYLYAARLTATETVSHDLATERLAWVQVARGAVNLNGYDLTAGDGAAIAAETVLTLSGASEDAEVLLFDMAASA